MSKKSNLKVVSGAHPGTDIENAPAHGLSMLEEMERMFGRMMSRGWLRPLSWDRPLWSELMAPLDKDMPRADVIDRNEEIVVRAEVPGIDKKDIEVSVNDRSVTIKGKTSYEEKEEKGDYYRCEISQGTFARTIGLPGEVDGAKAKAAFKDGMLELTLPKVAKSKRHPVAVD